MADRLDIPASLKRAILVEAGHRCAIPTCRFPTTEIAHIVPYAEVQDHKFTNLIALCPNCHTRYDAGEIDRKSIVIYKRKLAFLTDRYSKFELNLLDVLRLNGKACVYGTVIVKNILDDGLIVNGLTIATFDYKDGTKEVNGFVAILTDKGRAFLASWIDVDDTKLTY